MSLTSIKSTTMLGVLAALVMTSYAQNYGGYYNGNDGSNNPYYDSDSGDDDGGNDFGRGGGFSRFFDSSNVAILIAHAVLATVAFAFFFPVGAILIRLGSFRGIWLVHGLFQLLGYMVYVAAAALGLYMVRNGPDATLDDPHPIIGIILLGLLFFQPFLGLIHHLAFKRYSRRTLWSYGHLWLGRIAITLGIINGGLGLRLANRYPLAPPSRAHIIGYSVAAGFMWLLYVFCAIIGERKRSRVQQMRKEKPVVKTKEVDTASKSSSRVEYS